MKHRISIVAITAVLAVNQSACPQGLPPNDPDGGSISTVEWAHTGRADDACSAATEHEPNDTISMANPVDCTANATLSGSMANGIDVFRYAKCGGKQLPVVNFQTDASGLRACVFVACATGKTRLDECPEGGSPTHGVEGLLGCCRDGAGTLKIRVDCDVDQTQGRGIYVDQLDTYIVVDSVDTTTKACAPYYVSVTASGPPP